MAHLFGRTLREAPGDVELPSHRLMLRAAMMRPLGAGIYSLLPLGFRVVTKVEQIIREEIDRIGGQEMMMPVVHPADVWRESGRYDAVGAEMTRFKDRGDRDMVLAMTHEEVVADLARQEINSYRQLPQLVYHLQTKWRDEPRARGGLIRVREFTMKDSYSLDLDEAGLDVQYRNHWRAYERIFRRVGLDFVVVGADTGMMGGTASHEFMALSDYGEDIVLICPNGDYAANQEVALFKREAAGADAPRPMAEVETPNATTIQALADYLKVPVAQTAKAVFFIGESGAFIFAVIRGDMDVNETKLRKATGERTLTPATIEQIRTIGAEPGYGSPVGVHDCIVVADESVRDTPNLVAGANRIGYHFIDTNLGRDWQANIVADIASAVAEMPCLHCGAPLTAERAIEVGNIFKLGSRYSAMFGAPDVAAIGESKPVRMGSDGIGSGRVTATVVEQNYDDKGIIWPASIAPYHVSLVSIFTENDLSAALACDELYTTFQAAGVEVLYDDRAERAGVKFNDADLIGCPVRVSVSARTLANGQAEIKARTSTEAIFVPLAETVTTVQRMIAEAMAPLSGD
ncbi:MAG: proline--tRNA ligase [Thermomicrobiales bacterium]